MDFSIDQLIAFIVRAKAATYIGSGEHIASCRTGSHDLQFHKGDFAYLDSYFGGSDFIGEEVVYHADQPVWAMNYYGRILEPTRITAAETGQIIKAGLSTLYQQGRFLGGWEHTVGNDRYFDTNDGDVIAFTGKEWITRDNVKVYELVYHGGLIKN
jgi:Domain of unknown function (DUF5680)